jgi:hypothetical protein
MVSKTSLVIYYEKRYMIGFLTSNVMSYMIYGCGRYWRLRKSKVLTCLLFGKPFGTCFNKTH